MKKGGAQRRLAWSELDQRFGARSPGLWRFYLRELRLPELRFTPDGAAAEFADFVPVESLLQEQLAAESRDLRACAECQEVQDIDRAEGIFADFERLEGWICEPCARKLSAYDFYQKYVAQGRK